MNSIKNAIVTVTLLAVGYGSYVVLKQPTGQQPYTANGPQTLDVSVEAPTVDVRSSVDATTPHIDPQAVFNDVVPKVEVAVESTSKSRFEAVPAAPQLPSIDSTPTAQMPSLSSPATTPQLENNSAGTAMPELPPLPDLMEPMKQELSDLTSKLSSTVKNAVEENIPDISETVKVAEEAIANIPEVGAAVSDKVTESVKAAEEAITNIQSPFAQPLDPPTTENPVQEVTDLASQPLESKIEPPVAALAEPTGLAEPNGLAPSPTTPSRFSSSGSFNTELAPTDTTLSAETPDVVAVEIPKAQTTPADVVEPLSNVSIPPIDESVGPIPPADENDGSIAFEEAWTKVQQDLRNQQLGQSLKTLTPWIMDSGLNKEQTKRCLNLLDQLAGTVIYSRDSHIEPSYIVQAGETLDEIAARHAVPQELLAKINGIAPPYALTTGESIKVIRGPFRASISLFKSEMTLFVGSNYYAGRFPVTIGRDLPPEAAFYEIADKSNGRSYFDRRKGREIVKGEPTNRYGHYWLGLRGQHITSGHSVGIHSRPDQFDGEEVGSISLDPLHAEDVFSILSIGSRVEIRP